MKILRCAILFSGNGSNMQRLIESLHNKTFVRITKPDGKHAQKQDEAINAPYKIEIALALCNNPSAYGITRCESLQIPCLVINHREFSSRESYDSALVGALKERQIEYIFLAGFMRILTPLFTQSFKIINIHPSFLPHHKGAHAIQESFEAREGGGVSVHWVNEELDGGEIITQKSCNALPDESLADFEARIHALEHRLYPLAILQALGLEAPQSWHNALETLQFEAQSPKSAQDSSNSSKKQNLPCSEQLQNPANSLTDSQSPADSLTDSQNLADSLKDSQADSQNSAGHLNPQGARE